MNDWLSHVDSSTVLWGQFIIYTIYCLVAISVVGWIASRLTKESRPSRISNRAFYVWVCALVVIGVSLHLTTYSTIPWVKDDLAGTGNIVATYQLSIGKNPLNNNVPEWTFVDPPASPIDVPCDALVKFSVASKDNTYGFGIFRQDNTMVAQMEVMPGHANDLLWTFTAAGSYNIRSTEYSGPAGYHVVANNAITVSGCK